MYSQNDEERFILEFFKFQPTGRFLDVGAFDGISISNTRRLLELGWSGVLVEPMWTSFDNLLKNCQPYIDRVTLILAAVGAERKLSRFWVDDHSDRRWSTTINRELLDMGSIMKPNPANTMVPVITMDELWPMGPFDYISLDAEWEDFSIIKSQPAEKWRTAKLITIEPRSLEERAKMKELFKSWGFNVVHETPENLLVSPRN